MLLPRPRVVAILAVAMAVLAAEWIRGPGYVPAIGMLGVALLAGGASLRRRAPAVPTILALFVAVVAIFGTRHALQARHTWREIRSQRTTRAFEHLADALHGLLSETELLATNATQVADEAGADLFRQLDALLPRGAAEMSVVVFDSGGSPVGWAGRSRVAPVPEGDQLDVRFERYHAAFEVRRTARSGRRVLASGLLWADPSVPRPHRSLLGGLGGETGVELQVYPPGAAPGGTEVFDYVLPGEPGDRLLFSVEPVAPDSSATVGQAEAGARRAFGWTLVLFLLAVAGVAGTWREGIPALIGLAWVMLRSPLGGLMLSERLFSPATYVLPALRPVGQSAGHLLIVGVMLLAGAGLILRFLGSPGPRLRVFGGLVLLAVPCSALYLADGIHPPPLGVEGTLWLTWQSAIALPLAGLVVIGSTLARRGALHSSWLSVALTVVAVLAAALISVRIWTPGEGWPWWLPALWLVPVVLPALVEPRLLRLALATAAAAALGAVVTWQAELVGRIATAERDFERLGTAEEPLAEPFLLRLAEQARNTPGVESAAGLYLLWSASDLAGQDFPVRLDLWDSTAARIADVALDSLDVPTTALAALVREFEPGQAELVHRLDRVPGTHYVLLVALAEGRILSVTVGPRTRLVTPTRLARILRPSLEVRPPYEISISPPQVVQGALEPVPRWRRTATALQADAVIPFVDGLRHVHVGIPVRGPLMLTAYGLLAVLGEMMLAVAIVGVVLALTGEWHPAGLGRAVRSFRFRLTLTLAAFFVTPMLVFAAWGLARADQENQRARDAAIGAVLRSAVVSAGEILREPPASLADDLAALAARLESDLFLYRGGRLEAASHPLPVELGLVEPLQDEPSFLRLALGDELELTRQATSYVSPVRVGYRVVAAGPPRAVAILATPQLASDWRRLQIQRDLSVLLLLAVVAGVGAALAGAQLAARSLSRPVAELERSAEAVGAGQAPPPPSSPPLEFEQVFQAFGQMAADVHASRAALDGARQRTAAVLSQVATGVIALEPGGKILLANARARELLSAALTEGSDLEHSLPGDAASIIQTIDAFGSSGAAALAREVERGGRVFRLQLARLSGWAGGVVVAIDDLTDVTRAARVLAWGEMAQQVAHEIKNPLTPIRLGVQHLRRVERERPQALTAALQETTDRILAEIERLDGIARGFSRFAVPVAEQAPLESMDIGAVAREAAALYRLGEGEFAVEVSGGTLLAPCRRDELYEVFGNLLANARNAGARHARIALLDGGVEVRDDGAGIPSEILPRVFEPRFSTNTSGTGLGLAIVKRLVESWGARIEIRSPAGAGTTVAIGWPA